MSVRTAPLRGRKAGQPEFDSAMKHTFLAITATALLASAIPSTALAGSGNSRTSGKSEDHRQPDRGKAHEGHRGKSQDEPPGWRKAFEHANHHAWKGFGHRPPRPRSR